MKSIDDRMKMHIESLNEFDRLVFLRNAVNTAIRDYNAKEKAFKANFNSGFNRVGIRGGKFTSLAAKLQNCNHAYQSSVNLVRQIAKMLQ